MFRFHIEQISIIEVFICFCFDIVAITSLVTIEILKFFFPELARHLCLFDKVLGLPWQMVPTLYRSLIVWETEKQTSQNYLHVKVSKISRCTVFIQYEGAFCVKIKIFT
ncbi:MAG: hypothetical protein ACK559_03020, partial [bacterium]